MSLLQILQQGIQAKERAQQADIERGLRELQIGKEEKLQRDRLSFQGVENKLDRQHELLKLSQQIAADRAEQMAGFAFEDQQRIAEEGFITDERIAVPKSLSKANLQLKPLMFLAPLVRPIASNISVDSPTILSSFAIPIC